MPSPVRRIAPKPRRWTEISPPSEIFPARLAEISFLFIFTSKTRSLSRNRLSHEQINVPLPGQPPRLCQVGDQRLHLSEWHIVQAIPVSELESAQSQSRDRAH